jgi:hypothetical protein
MHICMFANMHIYSCGSHSLVWLLWLFPDSQILPHIHRPGEPIIFLKKFSASLETAANTTSAEIWQLQNCTIPSASKNTSPQLPNILSRRHTVADVRCPEPGFLVLSYVWRKPLVWWKPVLACGHPQASFSFLYVILPLCLSLLFISWDVFNIFFGLHITLSSLVEKLRFLCDWNVTFLPPHT